MASEIMLIEPEIIPAVNFKTIIKALELIESPAANFFSVIIFILEILPHQTPTNQHEKINNKIYKLYFYLNYNINYNI